jgi:hypothetical protein
VIKADSDPINNETTLTVGCLLALKWDLVQPEIYYATDYPAWTPVDTAAGSTPNICFLSSVVAVALDRCGITQATGNPGITFAKAVASIDLSGGYLEIASRIIAEAGFYGFIDAADKLRLRRVLVPATKGPFLTINELLTIEAIGNPPPPEEITISNGQLGLPTVQASPNYLPLPSGSEPYTWLRGDDGYYGGGGTGGGVGAGGGTGGGGNDGGGGGDDGGGDGGGDDGDDDEGTGGGPLRDWIFQQTISPAETFAVEYRFRIAGPPVRFETRSDSVSFVSVSEVVTEYDTIKWFDKDNKLQNQDVIKGTISTTTTCVGAANPTRWKSKLEAGSPAFPSAVLTKITQTYYGYQLTEDGPIETMVTTDEYEPRIAFAGGLSIENYKNIDLGTGNILLRRTIVEKEGNVAAGLTKQATVIYEAWGATAAGKTVAASIMAGLKRAEEADRISGTYTLVDRMSALVCRGVEKTINIGRGTAPAQPNKLDQENERLQGAQERLSTNGSWNQSGPLGKPYESQYVDMSFGSAGTNSTDKYDMQFAPDSYLRPATDAGDNNTGLKYVYVSSATAAYEYGRAIHYILSGMANGKSITTELRNIPSEPMGTLYLEAAGTVGRFRANGTTFAWDAQGLVVGCDAMLDGGAGLVTGASGDDWFPMMVAATNLPTVTATVNSTPALANTITAPGGFDPMAPGNVWASFGTTGVEGDVYAADLTRASVVGAVAENVQRESVSRSLTWVLEAPYSLTATTESLVSVTVNYGTASVVNEMFAGSGSGVIADLSAEITPERLYAGSGSGVIADLSGEVFIERLLAGSGSGVIADLSTETLALFAGSGSGVIEGDNGADPYFSSVILLCGFNGSNESTTIVDEGPLGLTLTASGSAQISTAQSVYGGSSLSMAGTGGVSLPSDSRLVLTGDFTLDARCWFNVANRKDMILGGRSLAANMQLARESGTELSMYNGAPRAASFATSANTWYALRWARSGSTVYFFADGTLLGTGTLTGDFDFSGGAIGNLFGNDILNGFVDELRLTAVCRSTANYTVDSAQFPRL